MKLIEFNSTARSLSGNTTDQFDTNNDTFAFQVI